YAAAVDAKIEGDRAFDGLDNLAERNGIGRTGELVAATGTAASAHKPPAHQIAHDLFEVILRNMLAAGDLGTAGDTVGVVGEMNHRAQGVLDFARYLHQAHNSPPLPASARAAGLSLAPERRPLPRRPSTTRSTYLTSISLSTFTGAPAAL